MSSLRSSKRTQRPESEINKDLENLRYDLETETKSLTQVKESLSKQQKEEDRLALRKRIADIEKSISSLRQRESFLKAELPPRPLPQPEYVKNSSGSFKRSMPQKKTYDAHAPAPPKKRTFYIEEKKKLGQAKRAIVLWDYKAKNKDELTLKAKKHVFVLQEFGYTVNEHNFLFDNKETDKDWFKVKDESTGKTGYYPSNYLEIEAVGPQPLFQAVAIFDYAAVNDDEISFLADDIISVYQKDDVGWWTGEVNGKVGLFPSNFVEAAISLTEPQPPPATPSLPYWAVALFDYQATQPDELGFVKGDRIQVTNQEMNGWWLGFLEKAPGKTGLIPGNYIQKSDLPVMKKTSSIAKSQAEFWKNMEKEGKLPILKTPSQETTQPTENENQPLLKKEPKKEGGVCCIIL